jgi:hypothetical protein
MLLASPHTGIVPAELLRRREVPNPKEAKALYSQEKIAKAEFESRNA